MVGDIIMSDTYYRDRTIKFVLSDCVGTGSECDEVLHSSVKIYIGDRKHPIIEAETLFEAIIAFDHWCTFHHTGCNGEQE